MITEPLGGPHPATQHWPKHAGNLTWCNLPVEAVPHKPHGPGYHPPICLKCIKAHGEARARSLAIDRQLHEGFASTNSGTDLPVTEHSQVWWTWYKVGVVDGFRNIYVLRTNDAACIEAYEVGQEDGIMDQALQKGYSSAKEVSDLF